MLDTATDRRESSPDDRADPVSEVRIKRPAEGTATFRDEDEGILSRLRVEAPDAWDLMGAAYRSLFHLRVQVVQLRTRVIGQHRQYDLDLAEFDGTRLTDRRRAMVRAAIEMVLEDSRGPHHALRP